MALSGYSNCFLIHFQMESASDKAARDNRAVMMNKNNPERCAMRNNHGEQLNPNNQKYQGPNTTHQSGNYKK